MQKFDFKDITLVPETISTISSRSEINIFTTEGSLPIIVSPMDTVVNRNNYEIFLDENLEVCLPRGEKPYHDNTFYQVT